ncbi:hypothetical protein [Rathayibacter tanaceti]|uniref:Uncharacterized protein n=3 Tax=Rathayibacter tanaceti TaxID=1671680 RepID=A0AAE6V7B7_9MICO|nr:hypothetical protein [Rathayibacter tanaceti]QHC56748.1 hypothetical protein GSU10_14680 [Rathayibacter tanaceti]
MSSMTKIRALLTRAQREETNIKLRLAFGNRETVDGFIIGTGRKWALLAATMTGGFFDGYVAVRLKEIERARPNRSWEARFSRTRPEWPPRPPADRPAIDLDTTSGMLATLLDPDALVGMERRKKYSALWVGVPYALTRHWLSLWEVDATAVWHERPLGYRPRTIALVRIGDHYLRGLAAIAGDRPPQDLPYGWAARSKHARRESQRQEAQPLAETISAE